MALTQSLTERLEAPLTNLGQHAWKFLLALGIGAVLVGIVAFAWPGRTTLVVAVLFGIYLIWYGISSLAAGLTAPMSAAARALTLLSGVLSVILGVLCFRDELQSVVLLGIWIGVGWIMAGTARIIEAFTAGGAAGGWAALSGVVLVIGGIVLIDSPIDSTVTLAWVTGIFLVVGGCVEIGRALALRRGLN